jgi:uncharacterized protein (TIGR02246 family)
MTVTGPEIVHQKFARLFRAGDLDGLLELYEDEATFVAEDGSTTRGKAAIRAALSEMLALDGELELETRYAAACGDIALLSNSWRLTATGGDGEPIELCGQTTEVARRQPNGRWLLIVDHPWGAVTDDGGG